MNSFNFIVSSTSTCGEKSVFNWLNKLTYPILVMDLNYYLNHHSNLLYLRLLTGTVIDDFLQLLNYH
ncbi:hypothetical protein [Spiroplasma endosymbiont of Virgichneumon dumeticola]|uniref:hypothetical protein n=1 Tax=Spiroplasma endosymbiont of Virgichneumon dumeticola TaxID=3139323 RepID=UPI0035C8D5D6